MLLVVVKEGIKIIARKFPETRLEQQLTYPTSDMKAFDNIAKWKNVN